VNRDERPVGRIGFQPSWVRELSPSAVGNLSLIRVDGVSMAPLLNPGDDILVDLGDGVERLRDGIYVLRIDDVLNVKRLAVFPQGRRFTIKSENPDYPDWTDCTTETVTVVGRVLWAGRRM
jgi:phage repressor protein C with HTH and peptisase S24 domain